MSNLLHVCIYNTEPESSQELMNHICSLNFIRMVGEVNTLEELNLAITEGGAKLIFFHLDPNTKDVVSVIDHIATRHPELALIALSHQSDPMAIIGPMRAGCDQFVCEPIDDTDLAHAVTRVAAKRFSGSPRSKCICVTGTSGGAGTTSIACNLAMEIGNLVDRECALVDLDLQFGDVASNFDADPRYNFFDLAESADQLDNSILMSAIESLPCKVAILSRPEMIEQHEIVTPEVVRHVIEMMRNVFENIVIDIPCQFTPQTVVALEHADLVIIVCQLLVPSIRNAKRYHDVLLRMGISEERIEFVVNRSDGKSERISIKDLEEAVKKSVFACIPNDYQFIARSIDYGRPIAAIDRNNPVREAIRKMAKRIITGPDQNAEAAEARGFFSRFLSK